VSDGPEELQTAVELVDSCCPGQAWGACCRWRAWIPPPDILGGGSTGHTEGTDLTGDANCRCAPASQAEGVEAICGELLSWKSGVRALPLDTIPGGQADATAALCVAAIAELAQDRGRPLPVTTGRGGAPRRARLPGEGEMERCPTSVANSTAPK